MISIASRKSLEVNNFEELPVELIRVEDFMSIQQAKDSASIDKNLPPVKHDSQTISGTKNVDNKQVDLSSIPVPVQSPVSVEDDSKSLPKVSGGLLSEHIPVENKTKEKGLVHDKKSLPHHEVPLPNFRHDRVESTLQEIAKKEVEVKKNLKVNDMESLDSRKNNKSHKEKKKDHNFNVDQLSELLSQKELAESKAKSPEDHVPLVEREKLGHSKLSQTEVGLLRKQISKNWNVVFGLEGLEDTQIRIRFHLDRDGLVVGEPEVEAMGGVETTRQILASGARRAIMQSQPFHLPLEKYDSWSEVIVNFQPSDIM